MSGIAAASDASAGFGHAAPKLAREHQEVPVRKLILSTAVVLVALPMGARADVSTSLTEAANVQIFYTDAPNYLYGEAWITSTTTPAPAADPGTLFPIVVDPNDPPEPPAAATELTQQLRGYLTGCGEFEDAFGNPTFRCFGGNFDQALEPGEVTFDSVPLPGNAMTFSVTVEVEGPFGDPMLVDLDGAFAEPSSTGYGACPLCTDVNPWMHDGTTHVDVDSYQSLIYRNGYDGTVSLNAPDLFTGSVPADGGMYYYLSLATHADAEV